MNKHKRRTALLLMAISVVPISACTKSAEKAETTSAPPTATAQAAAPTAAEPAPTRTKAGPVGAPR